MIIRILRRLCHFHEGLPSERAGKVVLMFAILLPLAILGRVGLTAAAGGATNSVKVTIQGEEFSLKIPKSWQKQTKANEVSWLDKKNKLAFGIIVQDIGTTWHSTLVMSPLDFFTQQLRAGFVEAKYRIIKEEMRPATRVGGLKAAKITMDLSPPGKPTLRQITYVIAGSEPRMINLMLLAPKSKFDQQYKNFIQPILTSFKRTKAAPIVAATGVTIEVTDRDIYQGKVRIHWITKSGQDLLPTYGFVRWGTDHLYTGGRSDNLPVSVIDGNERPGTHNFVHFFKRDPTELNAPLDQLHFQVCAWQREEDARNPVCSSDVHIVTP